MSLGFCRGCLEKQRRIDDLQEEMVRLKAKLRYQERKATEGAFGSSTPSSKIPVKPNSLAERQARRGGARPGHPGHGRTSLSAEAADRVETLSAPASCPHCRAPLENDGVRWRTVVDCPPAAVQRLVFRLERKRCPRCGRAFQARPPGVLPRARYGNQLLSEIATQHYLYGTPLGRIEERLGIGHGSLLAALHRLAERLRAAPEKLRQAYRRAPVRHADETGWRTDGQNGYAWIFSTPDLSFFRFRLTRSAKVVEEVFGSKRLPGGTVVDRYAAYNRAPTWLQYCYTHLDRDVADLGKDFPAEPEVQRFVEALRPLLIQAIQLRALPLSDRAFRREAARLKQAILDVTSRDARHPGIWDIQRIFREHPDRLYHWADDRRVPADNNRAERDLRPTVIARKVSFGSQSLRGAQTRETLMTILHTLRKRGCNVVQVLTRALDRLAQNPTLDPYRLLFAPNTS